MFLLDFFKIISCSSEEPWNIDAEGMEMGKLWNINVETILIS